MARAPAKFVCQSCGTAHAKWAGRCEGCGAWNTLVEEASGGGSQFAHASKGGGRLDVQSLQGSEAEAPRLSTGISEFDRVCGGGLVPASGVLIGGDPGIGKSTILLQVAAALANSGRKVLYISGEEAREQVRLRARRLSLNEAPVDLASTTNVRDILATLTEGLDAKLVDLQRLGLLKQTSNELASSSQRLANVVKDHEKNITSAMNHVVTEINSSFHILELTEKQEEKRRNFKTRKSISVLVTHASTCCIVC